MLASFQADEIKLLYSTYLIHLGNDDDKLGAPAAFKMFVVIPLAPVTLKRLTWG